MASVALRRVVGMGIGVVAALLALVVPCFGQPPGQPSTPAVAPGFNERQVTKTDTPEDRRGIWVLDFHFKDPRVVTVDIPGRGRKLVWYLWYQVSNATGEQRTFIPDFVWVSHDETTVHHDQVLNTAVHAIRRLEDPENITNIKNSNTISLQPIPVSREFDETGQRIAFPNRVTGVATWDDINPRSTQFSIYVYGLSDGWSQVDGPDGKPIIRSKTLQLKFKRLGDHLTQNSQQIRFIGHEWVYATFDRPIPVLGEGKAGVKALNEGKDAPPPPAPAPAPGPKPEKP